MIIEKALKFKNMVLDCWQVKEIFVKIIIKDFWHCYNQYIFASMYASCSSDSCDQYYQNGPTIRCCFGAAARCFFTLGLFNTTWVVCLFSLTSLLFWAVSDAHDLLMFSGFSSHGLGFSGLFVAFSLQHINSTGSKIRKWETKLTKHHAIVKGSNSNKTMIRASTMLHSSCTA